MNLWRKYSGAKARKGSFMHRANHCSREHGFTLVGTIFILVVLAALGSYMVKLSTVQNSSSSLMLQGSRAWYSALSGMEWTAYQIQTTSACPAGAGSFLLDGFLINVDRCDTYPVTEGPSTYTLYDVEITASYSSFGNVDYVSRTIRATISGS